MENTSSTFVGTLYVVATPIGNLDDMSKRAITTLKEVDVILAEDTRHSLPLLTALGINKPLLALHAHNESNKCEQIIAMLQKGESVALISDAGTPLISDPGFVLVRRAQQLGIRIIPIPGPCALITALCVSGIPCDSFMFIGFLPAKHQARITKLQSLHPNEHTIIIYESTHRLLDCIDDIISVYGDEYQFVLAKELTKSFEQLLHGSGVEIKEWLQSDKARIKGEFVIILPEQPKHETMDDDNRLLQCLLTELPLKQAVKLVALYSKTPKNDLYKMALTIQKLYDNVR